MKIKIKTKEMQRSYQWWSLFTFQPQERILGKGFKNKYFRLCSGIPSRSHRCNKEENGSVPCEVKKVSFPPSMCPNQTRS